MQPWATCPRGYHAPLQCIASAVDCGWPIEVSGPPILQARSTGGAPSPAGPRTTAAISSSRRSRWLAA
eukprot:8356589-Lingulodinium_polyedra.AAC.1